MTELVTDAIVVRDDDAWVAAIPVENGWCVVDLFNKAERFINPNARSVQGLRNAIQHCSDTLEIVNLTDQWTERSQLRKRYDKVRPYDPSRP